MCIGDKEIFSCKRINTFITTTWTQNCLLLSDDVYMKEIATTEPITASWPIGRDGSVKLCSVCVFMLHLISINVVAHVLIYLHIQLETLILG